MEFGTVESNLKSMDCPPSSPFKVHHRICIELLSLVDGISSIIPAIESSRPPCVHALCLVRKATDEAKILIQQCSESSKLYLAYSGNKILSGCLKIQKTMDLCLSQLQNMVPRLLSLQVSVILGDIRSSVFVLDSDEHDVGRGLRALHRQQGTTSDCLELYALQLACKRLQISSASAFQIEKASIKSLLTQIQNKDSKTQQILSCLLSLLRKHGESVLEEIDNLRVSNGNDVRNIK